MFDFAKSFLAA